RAKGSRWNVRSDAECQRGERQRLGVELVQELEFDAGAARAAQASGTGIHEAKRQRDLKLGSRRETERKLWGDAPRGDARSHALHAQRNGLELDGAALDDVRVFDAERTAAVGVVEIGLGARDGGRQAKRSAADREGAQETETALWHH